MLENTKSNILTNIQIIREYMLEILNNKEDKFDFITKILENYYKSLAPISLNTKKNKNIITIWINNEQWLNIKNKFTDLLSTFFPNIEIWQNLDYLTPSYDIILSMLKKRIIFEEKVKLSDDIKQETIDNIISNFNIEILGRYNIQTGKNKKYLQYLCSIYLDKLEKQKTEVHIWRDGTIYPPTSESLSFKNLYLLNILSKSFFIKNINSGDI